ncbi:glycosyltransferase [Rhizobium sp. S163]|uniref:glycosyltransferase family 2 protein n=1 Tax=Rhizobium sp. S163 TaxID=3055039 RepID=UPI0025A99A00|nr:glycosyltransferase [Rhizobium sp. S163]MDM9646065.1 glycosyltransferase [Rhizobium sp. S163]
MSEDRMFSLAFSQPEGKSRRNAPKQGLVITLLTKMLGGRIRKACPLQGVHRVSVVVPCYNYGRFLRQCVTSLITDQPGIDVEIIIVDDKSTDNSLETARQLQREEPCVKVIAHETNQGHIATYNEGLDAATGDYVLLLSADDLVTPGALTRAAELLAAEPSVGLVYGNAIHFHDTLPQSRTDQSGWIIWPGNDWLSLRCKSGYNVVASPEVIMRTSTLRSFGGYRADLPHAGDFEMWLRTSAVADIGFLLNVDQAYHRHHTSNMNKVDFSSGTTNGRFIDLSQRWQSFQVVFSGVGRGLHNAAELLELARKTMSRQALEHVSYAYARGKRDFPYKRFEALALEIDPAARQSPMGRAVARRERLGILPLPIHPLWALPAIAFRLAEYLRRWRRGKIGV